MAILKFTEKDKMASKVMSAGYYSAEVVEIGEPKKSSTLKSFNMLSKFRIIEDEHYEGKELEVSFNTNMKNPSTMGSLYLMPHFYLLHVAAATADCELADVPEDIDTDSLKGLKLDLKIEKVISDGIPMNTISAFLPYGAGKKVEKESSPF